MTAYEALQRVYGIRGYVVVVTAIPDPIGTIYKGITDPGGQRVDQPFVVRSATTREDAMAQYRMVRDSWEGSQWDQLQAESYLDANPYCYRCTTD